MDELKMLGNALKGSRPLLIFDKYFDQRPHLKLLKEIAKELRISIYTIEMLLFAKAEEVVLQVV